MMGKYYGKRLSRDPADRMGVFKRYADVSPRYRLGRLAASYADRDVWAEYAETEGIFETSDRQRQDRERAIESWKQHMADRGQHHALATPEDVNEWCESLLADRKPKTVYNPYWITLAQFYDWLMYHTEHQHVYNPFLMAAVEYADGPVGAVWEAKVGPESSPPEARQ